MGILIGTLMGVVEAEAGFGLPGVKAGVVIQQIVEKVAAIRIVRFLWIGIAGHGVKWQRVHGEGIAFVEIHVLHKTISKEQVVARPSGRKLRQSFRIEIECNLVSRTEDDESVVGFLQQRLHIAIAGISAGMMHKRPGSAHLVVVIGEISSRSFLNLARIAMEAKPGSV